MDKQYSFSQFASQLPKHSALGPKDFLFPFLINDHRNPKNHKNYYNQLYRNIKTIEERTYS